MTIQIHSSEAAVSEDRLAVGLPLDHSPISEQSCRQLIESPFSLTPDLIQRLASLADYVAFLNRPSLKEQVQEAEREFKAGKGVNWRKVRSDV